MGTRSKRSDGPRRRRSSGARLALGAVVGLLPLLAGATRQGAVGRDDGGAPRTLEETRLAMSKWIETQQIISKERKDWQQGKEILLGRLELVKQEVTALEEKIAQAQSSVAEADRKRDEALAERRLLDEAGAQLDAVVAVMEGDVRRLYRSSPEPIRARLERLHERIPADLANTRVSIAERFQNVLGILNELNKANNEITVAYEVHELAGGKPAEVQALYVGLAQAYYVSARGEAGIGRPSDDGWKWEASDAAAGAILTALEIVQGKQSPAFVPLPVELR